MSSKISHAKPFNVYSKMQLEQIQHLNNMIEAKRSRVKSIAFRKEILEKQRVRNYTNEYERIRSHLNETAMPYVTREGLKSRTEHLKSLGALAVSM